MVCVYRQGAATNKLPSPTSPIALSLAYLYDSLSTPRPAYTYTTESKPTNKPLFTHIVLIVDESLRWDYSPFLRVKTPPDSKYKVLDYGRASSGANCSHTSNIMLRKGAKSSAVAHDFYANAFLWSYARNAGYKTHLYDAQGGGGGHDFFTTQERELIDVNLSNTAIKQDSDIIDSLSYLNDSTPSFTYIIKKGSHFPYHAPFLAKPSDDYTKANHQRILYLSNVIYQSDVFFTKLLSQHYAQKVLFIYTSDHGQNLFDRAGLTHCTAGSEPYDGEGEVPLVLISNGDVARYEAHLAKNCNRASHFNIAPTILEAMGYDEGDRSGSDVPLSRDSAYLGGFFYGVPFGLFGKQPDFYTLQSEPTKSQCKAKEADKILPPKGVAQ